jgi:energy-coupling factor transporter ATP-binding protein EcfA2
VVIVTHDIEFVAECNPRVILMVQGQIVADGEAKQILTNPDVALKAFVVPPQITQIFQGLTDLGFPSDVIDVCDAGKILIEHLNKEKSRH